MGDRLPSIGLTHRSPYSGRTLGELSLTPRRPERPLLEGRATPFIVEADEPEVAVGLRRRLSVADLDADHSGVALHSDYLAPKGERFIRTAAFFLPHR